MDRSRARPDTAWRLTAPFLLALLALLLLGSVVLLIAGVESVEFLPGRGFASSSAPSSTWIPGDSDAWRVIAVVMRFVTIAAAVLLLLQAAFSRSHRRVYLCILAVCCIGLFVTNILRFDELPANVPETPTLESRWPASGIESVDSRIEDAPIEANALQYSLLAVALSCLLTAAAWLLLRRRRRGDPFVPSAARDDILRTLANARRRLQAGEDARSVVLYCYQEMLVILGAKGRIDATALTPREFEHRLRCVGLSDTAVTRLTSLFEVVRYADRSSTDIAGAARECLNVIRTAHPIEGARAMQTLSSQEPHISGIW